MESKSAQLKEGLSRSLQEDWAVSDREEQKSLLRHIVQNLDALNRQLTQEASAGNWTKMMTLADKLSTFAANTNVETLQTLSATVSEASQNEDSLYCLASLEHFHRLLTDLKQNL